MKFEDFWYVVARQEDLRAHTVLSRTILGEWLAVFRGENGQPVALRDRCLHRNSRLSCGRVKRGKLHCPYHGWVYDHRGQVVAVPAAGEEFKLRSDRTAKKYQTCEQDGYIYVRLAENPAVEIPPFAMPYYQQPGWETVRVVNRFQNNLTNCVENFIDIPHTVSVHPGIFRKQRQQKLTMTVTRKNGSVLVEYENETDNLGWWSKFLNPQGQKIRHTDSFYLPNITSVEYNLGENRRFFITSQSIPETADSTLVYTDVTFNYGIWNKIAKPLVYWTAQSIIAQDIKILGIQQEVIAKYGPQFANTPADTIHIFVESIQAQIAAGKDPRNLPDISQQVTFWV